MFRGALLILSVCHFVSVAKAPGPSANGIYFPGTKADVPTDPAREAPFTHQKRFPDPKGAQGSLTITVENVPEGPVHLPGSNGEVILYDAKYNVVGSKQTDSTGRVTFSEVAVGNDYKIEVYHNRGPDRHPSSFGDEFWGSKDNVSIGSGSDSLTFIRNTPYARRMQVYIADTEYEGPRPEGMNVTQKAVQAGTPLRIEVQVKNPDQPGAYAQDVRARLLVDRDVTTPYDLNGTSDSHSIPKGETKTVEFHYTPSEGRPEGIDYFAAPATQTKVAGDFIYTDSWDWTPEALFSSIEENTRKFLSSTCTFSTFDWIVKDGGPIGPGPNEWSGSKKSAWCDEQGRLHLKIRKVGQTWHSAEVFTETSPGYGTYRFKMSSDVENYDQNVVVGLFTYRPGPKEIDVEFSKWSVPTLQKVGHFNVWNGEQGDGIREPKFNESFALNLSTNRSTHEFTWTADKIHFRSWRGHSDAPLPNTLLHDTSYRGENIPPAADERLHINLWLNLGRPPTDQQEVELIVDSVSVDRTPTIAVDSSAIDFGTRAVESSAKDSLSIENTGAFNLTMTPKLAGDTAQFHLSSPSTRTLSPGSTQKIALTYNPQTAGTHTATLALTHNASNEPSPMTISVSGEASGTIPVELTHFEARRSKNTALLSWGTASETNNARFEVLRNASRQNAWEQVASVKSKAQGGTSSKPHHYRFTDKDLPFAADTLMYRLRQVDLDGTTTLTRTVTVRRPTADLHLKGIAPNPAHHRANIRFAAPQRRTVALRLFDTLGREVRTIDLGARAGRQQIEVDVSALPTGLYLLQLRAGDQTATTRMMIVE